jgi:hypothetical protein
MTPLSLDEQMNEARRVLLRVYPLHPSVCYTLGLLESALGSHLVYEPEDETFQDALLCDEEALIAYSAGRTGQRAPL